MEAEKTNLFYMKFCPKDFVADPHVAAMTISERGAYIMLLCYCWMSDEPGYLKDDDKLLAKLSGAGRSWNKVRDAVKCAFKRDVKPGYLCQTRILSEYNSAVAASTQNAVNGLKGAQKRWGGYGEANSPPNGEANGEAIASNSQSYSNSNSNSHQPSEGEMAGGEIIQKLKDIGIDTAKLPAAKLNGTTCNTIIRHWLDIISDSKVRNPKGALVTRLINHEALPRGSPSAKSIAMGIRDGIISSISDIPVSGDAKHNSDGVHLDGRLVLPKQLIRNAEFG